MVLFFKAVPFADQTFLRYGPNIDPGNGKGTVLPFLRWRMAGSPLRQQGVHQQSMGAERHILGESWESVTLPVPYTGVKWGISQRRHPYIIPAQDQSKRAEFV